MSPVRKFMRVALLRLNLASEDGDNRMFLSLAQALVRAGHTVIVYAAQIDERVFSELRKGLNINIVPPPILLEPIAAVSGIAAKIKERFMKDRLYAEAARRIGEALTTDFDVVVSQNDHTYRLGVGYKKLHPKAKFVWIMNNAPFYHTHKDKALINALSYAMARAERVRVSCYSSGIDLIVVNDKEKEDLGNELGVPTILLRIAVDFSHFFSPVKTREAGNKAVTLLGVGSLSPARKFEDIVSAVAELRKGSYDARAIIVCADFWKSETYRNSLLRLADTLHVKEFVDFRFEGATEVELRELQKKSDVFVFPNIIPIWGMAALEGMASGLPLVVSDTSSVAEVLHDRENAVFSEAGNPHDIALKIKSLIDDPAMYKKIAEAGQKFVKEHLNWDAYAKRFLEAIPK